MVDTVSPLTALDAAVDDVLGVDLAALEPRDLLALTTQIELVARRVEAAVDTVVTAVERSGAFAEDGHRSLGSFLRGSCRAGPDATSRVKTTRVLTLMPTFAAAYRAGTIPLDHVRSVARAVANPRIRDLLCDADTEAVIADQAATLEFNDFDDWLSELVDLADQDGAESADDRAHDTRSASLNQTFNGSWLVRAQLSAVAGIVLKTVLSAFEEAELAADWAEAKQRLGDDATYNDLSRTPSQRRADALVAMAVAASTATGQPAEPLVQVLIDQETFERELARSADAPADDVRSPDEVVCRTLAGDRILARDAVALALAGYVQRVVIDPHNVVVNMGRRRRFFTGNARQAALIQAALRLKGRLRCLYPGCCVPGCASQIDHRHPFRSGGRTDQSNADAKCLAHNLLKETGFVAERRPDGTWHARRPDGTAITAAV